MEVALRAGPLRHRPVVFVHLWGRSFMRASATDSPTVQCATSSRPRGRSRRAAERDSRAAALQLEGLETRELLTAAGGVWSFASARLHPIMPTVLTNLPGTAPGDIFLTANGASPGSQVGQTGPVILDRAGNPIWALPASPRLQYLDFQEQTLFGQPVLTWWQGRFALPPSNLPTSTALPGSRFVIYNDQYRPIASVAGRNGFTADVHDLTITPQGNAVFIATRVQRADLTPYGGPKNGEFIDPEIQEINLRTGQLVFAWNMAAHVPLSASYTPAPTTAAQVWDAYHVNSVDVSPDGSQILVSARSTSTIYDISAGTGQVLWQLGGKQSNFQVPPDLVTGPDNSIFQYQHDARFVPNGISLFDDSTFGYSAARGMILNVNTSNSTATPVALYYHDPAITATSQGNMQVLPNGNVLIGWGADMQVPGVVNSYYSEYAPDGTLLYDAVLPGADVSYRAFVAPWVGLPLTRPSAVVVPGPGQTTVYASWNGSTETASWQLLAGPSSRALTPVATAASTGFETAITTTNAGPFYEVRALNAAGAVLNTSFVINGHRLPGL
jgi:hypothetical protein